MTARNNDAPKGLDMEQKVEQRAKALRELWDGSPSVSATLKAIARAELVREAKLLDAVERARMLLHTTTEAYAVLTNAQAAHEAEFAPKPRTLREVAKEVVEGSTRPNATEITSALIPKCLLDELAAALKREGGE